MLRSVPEAHQDENCTEADMTQGQDEIDIGKRKTLM
jgi:hypothetical protein